MTIDYLRPNSNVNSSFNVSTYANIDEEIFSGDAGDGNVVVADRNDDNETQVWGLSALNESFDEIQRLTIHYLSYDADEGISDRDAYIGLNLDGSPTESGLVNIGGESPGWRSVVIDGSWTESDFASNRQLIVTLNGTLGTDEAIEIDTMYVEVSGTAGGPTVYSGVNYPLTGTNDETVGSIDWLDIPELNPSNLEQMRLSNDTYTIASAVGSGTESHYLLMTNFNHQVPLNADIQGIEFRIERNSNYANMIDHSIRLSLDGNFIGEDKATSEYWSSGVDRTDNYGGQEDMWSVTLTPQAVNSANFGVGISAKRETGVGLARIDHVEMIIYYTLGDTVTYTETQKTKVMKTILGSHF